jgi:hypothetical protein
MVLLLYAEKGSYPFPSKSRSKRDETTSFFEYTMGLAWGYVFDVSVDSIPQKPVSSLKNRTSTRSFAGTGVAPDGFRLRELPGCVIMELRYALLPLFEGKMQYALSELKEGRTV